MEVVNKNNEQQQAVSNEQKLQYENTQMKAMLNNMRAQMENMNMANVFKRLEFLFKVIEHREAFSSEFVVACTEEIEGRMTLVEDTEDSTQNTENKEDK